MKMIKHPFSGRITPENDIGYDYRRKVGNHIRDLREAAGLTQRELGQATDITNNAVSAIELGRNPIPPERYRAFADALGVDPKEFGEFLLEYTDRWLYALLRGEQAVRKHNLGDIPPRLSGRD
jgi:transcriptional regulator with XRE-family HTH domain